MPPRPAATVQPSDLGSYQHAVRLVLTHDVITAARPRPGTLDQVLKWADQMTNDLRDLLGYTLIATTRQVRLTRRLDALDPTQTSIFAAKSGRPFDRRRLAYLCLVLASFQRSRVEISLADLVRAFTPAANAIEDLRFDPTVTQHKAAVVDVLDWLVDRGALRLSDGSVEAWANDTERGDALYDIDHDICTALFRPARPVQHLTSAAGLLDATFISAKRQAQREAAAQRAARALIEYPVVYYAQVEPEVAEALRAHGVAEHLARLTGMAVERRAEGVMLADAGGRFTDRPFPGRGGAVNRAAGLLLAKIADHFEDPDEPSAALEVPAGAEDQRDLLERIDSALPADGVVRELAWSAPAEPFDYPERTRQTPRPSPLQVPFVPDTRLRAMIGELYDELGAASFTITWQHDPAGLLAAALAFLADLRLLRPVPGGVLVLPAAARYRNIRLALPVRHADGQLALCFPPGGQAPPVTPQRGDYPSPRAPFPPGGQAPPVTPQRGDYPSPRAPLAPRRASVSERFKPTRAGVINVWDYVDEEWAFADGRLALRGHNGSGKTKALEVLFPFVLDGVADSRRLDPFSGENRTMKSNLLYRGQESEYGYVWIEFARGRPSTETVTLIIGMRAHRNTDGVRMSFYVTGKRLGADFGLLSADSRPLTERQLRAVLEPDAWRRTATEYRDLVDSRLFGLGRERYAQLLDLLLALRRPLLAKDLDPGKVSDTLTSGLSPVDEDLVQQAARDFENLAAVQKLFDDLTAANAAVGEFRAHYEAYLRAHVKFALDRVQARAAAAAAHAEQITAAAAARRAAIEAERAAETERDARRDEGEQSQARLAALKSSEEYKAQGRIEDKRREVARRAREVADQQRRLEQDHRRIRDLQNAAAKLSQRAAQARSEAGRYARELADAAQRSGIADDGFGPVDAGDELMITARARVAARRDDVGEIRKLLGEIRDAKAKRGYAEQDLGRKETAEQRQQEESEAAAARLNQARASAAADLTTWATRWAELAETSEALAEALEHTGEAGAISLAEVFDGRTAERQAATITARTTLESALRDVRERLAALRAERDAIAAEKDDAPPASDLRIASRDGRPGAPLWQLVRFADDVPDDTAAAIEGALYGAGLLTAWLHPDPALTRQALADAEADGYLLPAAPAPGRTLADALLPEKQNRVAPDVITAVLRSIALTEDVFPPGGKAPPVTPQRGDYPSPLAPLAISVRAQFSYGVHAGARPKAAPEYIGATNRANRRRTRLAEYDELIAGTLADERRAAADLDRAVTLLEDFRRARRELPDTRPVATAAEAVGRHAALLARARTEVASARKDLDTAIAEVDGRNRQLRQAAAQRRMPTAGEEVDAIARAAAEFENAAGQLHAERGKLAQAEEDLAERTETIELSRLEYAEAEAAFDEARRLQQALEEEFRTLEETLQADVRCVLEQVKQTERAIRAAEQAYRELDRRTREEHDKVTRAQENERTGRQSLTEAVGQLYEQAAAFGEYARPDLRPLVGVTTAVPWPEPANWPAPERAGDELAALLTSDAPLAGDPADAVRGVLPPAATEILDAVTVSTRGGRQVTETALKNTADRMSVALKDFTEALAACDEDYRVDWEPGAVVTVHVIDDEGRKPVARFATRIAERAADQGVLLEDRERKVLEDELLAALAQQIHGRVVAARDLTRDMNADTRSKPMSSGIAVGIRWGQSDKITEAQRAASRLLMRDSPGPERLAELRGLLRDMIREYRAGHPRATYREALASVLDYRSWHAFELLLIKTGEPEARLTRARHSVMSGGEKSAAIHLPLFAAANALYSSAKAHCPRLIALDEAFVGIDERYKPDLFGLAVKFGLDLFMTGHDLWVTTATVPMIAHYDMYHDKATRTVSALLMLWDGLQLIDASVSSAGSGGDDPPEPPRGYAGNEALVTELLGFRPTRHAPLDADSTLRFTPAEADTADDGDDDAE